MASNRKFIIVITLLFNLFWLQPLHSMQLSLNPLTWVYGLYYKAYYHFSWITPTVAEVKITQRYNNLYNFIREICLDMVLSNDQFGTKISHDGDALQSQFQETRKYVQQLDIKGLIKLVHLKLTRRETEAMFKKGLDATIRNFSNAQEATLNTIDQIIAETSSSKDALALNNKFITSLGRKISGDTEKIKSLQQNRHNLLTEKISNIQEFCTKTKNSLNELKQTAQQCREQCEKKKELVSSDGKTIKNLLLELQELNKKQQKVLNKLSRSSQSQDQKIANAFRYRVNGPKDWGTSCHV